MRCPVLPLAASLLLRLACTTCNPDVQDGILDANLPWVVLGLTSPFALVAGGAWWLERAL
jgi:hypothetical protein